MSNVQVYEGMDSNQLMAMMGGGANQQAQEVPDLLPILKINYQEEDADGNEIKKGLFVLGNTPDKAVYAKEVKLRVFGDFMQYLHYDADAEEVVNRSIVHRMGDEPMDEKGTVRCGRPAGKEYHALSDDQKKKYTGITCFRYLYGIVSFEGETSTGEAKTIENVPCLFRTKGASFLNFTNEVINGCSAKNLQFQQVESTLTTQRHKKGSVTYFTPHFAPDFSNILEIGPTDVETMKYILSMIKDTNDQIRTKHDDAIRAKNNVSAEAVVTDAISAEFSEVEEELGF